MTVKIDSNIVTAIKDYVSSNQMELQQFAAEMNISGACVTKWMKVGNGITEQKWDVLFPKIKQFLPKDRIYIDDSGSERYLSGTENISNYIFNPQYVPTMIHIVQLDKFADFDNLIQSVSQFGVDTGANTVEFRHKHSDKTGIIAVQVDSSQYAPVLPENSTLYVCTSEAPKHDGVVVVKNSDCKVYIARYIKDGKQLSLNDINTGEPLATCNISEARKFIQWIFPVLYYEVVTF
jgi:hypothetical protein